MSNNLIGSIFQSTSVDRVLVTDPTQVKDPVIMNIPSNSMKGIFKSVLKNIKPAIGAAAEIARLVSDAKSGYYDKTALLGRALDVMGTSYSSILNQVSDGVKDIVNGTAVEFLGDVTGDLTGMIIDGDVTRMLRMRDPIGVYDTVGMVSDILGNEKLIRLVNVQAEAAVVAGVLDSVVTAGVPELVDDVVRMTQYDEVSFEAMAWLSTRAIESGDRVLLDKTIEYSSPEAVLAYNPGYSSDVVNGFVSDKTNITDMMIEASELKTTLGKVDGLWDRISDDKGGYYRLDNYGNGSSDFDRVMTADIDSVDALLTMTAKAYEAMSSDPSDIIRGQYPDAVIRDDVNYLDVDRRYVQLEQTTIGRRNQEGIVVT